MDKFLNKVCKDILSKHVSMEQVVCVLPSERACVFLSKMMQKALEGRQCVMPEIISIETFVKELSGFENVDDLELLFLFYEAYLNSGLAEDKGDSFLKFLSWAPIVLQDFNEIDRYLVDSSQIFSDLLSVERIRSWQIDESKAQHSKLISSHLNFVEKLPRFYQLLQFKLKERGVAYQGMMYREAVAKMVNYLANHATLSFYMIGFNALNKSEEHLFQAILESDQNEVYWDVDKISVESNDEVGLFFRKYLKEWDCYKKRKPKWIEDFSTNAQEIEVVASAINVTAVKHIATELLLKSELSDTAIVMAEEKLLPLVLGSIPQSYPVNITMGYGVTNLPFHEFLMDVFELKINVAKNSSKGVYSLGLLKIVKFLRNIKAYEKQALQIVEIIESRNLVFIKLDILGEFLKGFPDSFIGLLEEKSSVNQFLKFLNTFFDEIRLELHQNELAYAVSASKVIDKVLLLNEQFKYIQHISTLQKVYKQLMSFETLDFVGSATEGLQVMGMLETRCLDFETIYLISVNEGILPSSSKEKSMIPFDIKIQYQMPTNIHKDAVYAYHFYRLIRRAKQVKIYYNTLKDEYGAGEKSRYITQLEIFKGIREKTLLADLQNNTHKPLVIPKDVVLMDRLNSLFSKGISPSSLNEYVRNPIRFYKNKVLQIKEIDEVEEELASNTIGTIVHDVLESLYTPFLKKILVVQDFKRIKQQMDKVVHQKIDEHFKEGDVEVGKNRLIVEVIKKFVWKLLQYEEQLVSDGNELVIIALEGDYHIPLVTSKGHQVRLFGKFDRIDELNGVRRIVDYKTGHVEQTKLKENDYSVLKTTVDKDKVLQVMMYALIYVEMFNVDLEMVKLQSGVYSFKNFKEGFMSIQYQGHNFISTAQLFSFKQELLGLIDEILDPNINFEERLN